MPVPTQRSESSPTTAPPILPCVVVVHASDVSAGAQSEPNQSVHESRVACEDLLLEEDAVARQIGPTPLVDRVQEEVMTSISPDGRPPHRKLRVTEWKWVLIGSGVLLLGAAVLAAMSSMAWPTMLFAGVVVLVLVGAAIPTWGAGLLRGKEERQARLSALVQEQDRPAR